MFSGHFSADAEHHLAVKLKLSYYKSRLTIQPTCWQIYCYILIQYVKQI